VIGCPPLFGFLQAHRRRVTLRMNFIRFFVALFVTTGKVDGEVAWNHCLDALEKGERNMDSAGSTSHMTTERNEVRLSISPSIQ
jgi:hypothetical protein